VVTTRTSGLCVLQGSQIKQRHFTTQLSQLPQSTFTAQYKVNLLQITQVTFSIKRIHISLASKADYSQHTLWCWENQMSAASSAKNIQSNGWPFKSPLCTAHWTLNSKIQKIRSKCQ